MRASSVLSVVLFAATAWSIAVTSPSQGAIWDASQKSQSVGWTSVSSDPTNFTIALVNMQKTPNINVILKSNVLTSAGSTNVDGPASGWPIGNGFQINLVQQNPTGVAILAQSPQFNITGTTVSFASSISSKSSSVSSGSPTISLASSPTPTDTSPSSSGAGGSDGITNGAMGLTVQTGFVVGLALVGGLLA